MEAGLGLVGLGIGLTTPSSTQAIMSSLPAHRAGIGSAVNNLVRELGGAFGIGLLGSVTLLRYQGALATASVTVPDPAFAGLSQALAADSGSALADAARQAYVTGLDTAMVVGAAIVLASALACRLLLPTRRALSSQGR